MPYMMVDARRSLRCSTLFSLGILSLMLLFSGCGKKEVSKVKSIQIIQGEDQCAPPNSECKKKLLVELLGPRSDGLLGGKGEQPPVAGVKVSFEVLPGSDLTITSEKPVSNPGGAVFAKIKTGSLIGDQYFKVVPEGFPKAAKTVRVVSGIDIHGDSQEAFVGHLLEDPVTLTVYGKSGEPIAGVPVYFSVGSTPEKTPHLKLSKTAVLTNSDGVAETQCTLGKSTGTYKIIAEVSDPVRGIQVRGVEIKELGLNLWGLKGLIITVLGGLAIFIFGMKLMSDGLQLIAGDKMKSILHFFASNRFVAVCAGALVTGVIQSSSACTVMVVGFVNAGLLTLRQAIGIVFGANIGTTITAQMISLKLGGMAFPAIILGLLVVMIAKRVTSKGWGQTLLGFGLLFFGLSIMGNELKIIGKFPTFIEFFNHFDCTPDSTGFMPIMPVLGALMIGTFLTFAIQSSSASMGIVLMLAAGGLVNFWTAVPLLLGTNIGTTITAILAAIGANERARQTAVAHVLFNVIGSLVMVLFFYVRVPNTIYPVFLYFINAITPGDAFAVVPENIVRHIAMAHTLFNIIAVLLFLPFIGLIAKICNMVIKIEDEKGVKIQHLEPHLLNTPSIAIEQSIQSIRYMIKESWDMVSSAMSHSFMPGRIDDKLVRELAEREEHIDQLQADVTQYLVQITERTLTEPQAGIVPLLMHCTNDAERIADHTENILALSKRLDESKYNLSESAKKEIDEMWRILKDQAEHVIACMDSTDKTEVHLAKKKEVEIDKFADKLETNHIARLHEGKCNPVTGIIFLEVIGELEKIGDHLANIADRARKIQKHHLELGS